jgi:transketolase
MSLQIEKKENMRDAFAQTLLSLSRQDPKVYAVDGDVANSTKMNIVAEENHDKFLEMGIAEQNMIGAAAGMATFGLQPWVCSFAAFITKRSLDQVQVTVAQPNSDVKLFGGYSGLLTGLTGKTHQSLEDLAIMRTLANMVVLAPGDAVEVRKAMEFAHEYHGPVYIRLARDPLPVIFDENYRFELAKGVSLKKGKDAMVVSTGTQTNRSLRAAKQLEREGYTVGVLHLSSIKPIDKAAIVEAAKNTGLIITSEEHSINGGLGSAVAEVLSEEYPTKVVRIGVQDCNSESAGNEALLKKHKLDPESMAQTIKQAIDKKKGE